MDAAVDATLASSLARATDPGSLDAGVCDELERFAARWRSDAPRRAPVHPLLAKHAASHGLEGLRRPTGGGRLASLANSSRIFHMTHIAKTGGRSVRAELMRLVRPVGGAEQCYPPFMHASRVNIIFFREPRAHALSQYLHGATVGREKPNAKWLRRKAAGYPMGDGPDGLAGGLARWAAYFAHGWTPARGDFFSYNPLNMMARTLTRRARVAPASPQPPPAREAPDPPTRARADQRGLRALEADSLPGPPSARWSAVSVPTRAPVRTQVPRRALELRLRQDLRGGAAGRNGPRPRLRTARQNSAPCASLARLGKRRRARLRTPERRLRRSEACRGLKSAAARAPEVAILALARRRAGGVRAPRRP